MFVISFLNGKPMVAGRNTAADGIIRMAGAVNAIDAYEGYKQISDEAVIAAGPDTVLVMQRGRDNIDAATVFSHAAFTMTPAAARKSFIAMDGLYLLGFGPRTATAARDLAETLYPALGHAVLPSERAPKRLPLMAIAAGDARLPARAFAVAGYWLSALCSSRSRRRRQSPQRSVRQASR